MSAGRPWCRRSSREAFQLHLASLRHRSARGLLKGDTTLVEFRLQEIPSGTLLLLTESGFDKVPAERRAEAFRMNDSGWTQQLKNIESHVAQRP